MTGVIIAGGLGTRLRSVVADRPKCLASVNGQPFILRLLQQLIDAGVDRLLLCIGYGGDQVVESIGHQFAGVPVLYSRENEPLGTAGALKLAFDRHSCESSWLVVNGDSFLDLNILDFQRKFDASSCVASVAAVQVANGSRFGGLTCSADGRVLAFEEKSDQSRPKWINGGVYLLTSRFLSDLPAKTPLSLEREVFPNCIQSGLFAYFCSGRFIDIGIPESYAEAQTFFAEAVV